MGSVRLEEKSTTRQRLKRPGQCLKKPGNSTGDQFVIFVMDRQNSLTLRKTNRRDKTILNANQLCDDDMLTYSSNGSSLKTQQQQQQQQNSTSIFAEFRSIRRDFQWQIHNASTKQLRYSMSKPTTRCQPPTLQGWQILSISLINCRMRWNPIEKSIPR
ncbi:hypothetical protein T07_6409 [Trichinella nelsoni]|uniref:Uncharacterized protein n=1 Tax=Trichinella nelsoni TaxID=6336 RepID=A0A0V0RTB2_9BILA|nr:hypothetical protein T07_6409 [Trichinella nelsoni]